MTDPTPSPAPAAGAQEPVAFAYALGLDLPRFSRWDAKLAHAVTEQGYTVTPLYAAPAPQVAEPGGVEREDEAWLEGEAEACDRAAATWGRKPVATRAEFVFRENAARYRRILASLRELAEWCERSRAAGRIAGELNRERLARLRAGRDATPASEVA